MEEVYIYIQLFTFYFWWCWVFFAVCQLSLVALCRILIAVSSHCSVFLLQCLLVAEHGLWAHGLSSHGTRHVESSREN